jgi:DNA helicase-2/ATP-dependent DNA helicase PcrA
VLNVRELLTLSASASQSLTEFLDVCVGVGAPEAPLADAVDAVNADADAGDGDAPARPAVTLMTLHAAKGLEWPIVFVTGCADGTLPFFLNKSVEEERRLFYVGITRARDRLVCTWPAVRVHHHQQYKNMPSRFLAEAGLTA